MATQQAFILIVEDDNGHREIPLGCEVYSIGKAPESDIRLFSLFVSKRHATLVRRQGGDGNFYYQIVDGNLKGKLSVQGLLINGQKRQFHNLENEDVIEFSPGVKANYYILHSTTNNPRVTDDEYILMGRMLIDDE